MKRHHHVVAVTLLLQLTAADRFTQWLAGNDHSTAALSGALTPEVQPEPARDLGFGLQRVEFRGEGPMDIEAVFLADKVLYVDADLGEGKRVRRELDRPGLLRHLAATTGARSSEVPAELVTAYERLFFPYEELQIGWTCGWGRRPAPGRPDIDLLVRTQRFDLIANILLGANPEGRVYAARALDGRETSPEVRAAIDAVFDSPLAIRHCSSDVIYSSPASKLRRR